MAEKSEKKTAKGLVFKGHTFELSHKFKLKANAEESKNFKKRGPRRVAALIFKTPHTSAEAVAEFNKQMKGKIKGDPDKVARNNVSHALNRLVRFALLDGIFAPAKKAAKKIAPTKVKAKAKAVVKTTKKVKADEDDEEMPKAKKATVKAKAKVEDDDEDEDEDEDGDEDGDEDEDED